MKVSGVYAHRKVRVEGGERDGKVRSRGSNKTTKPAVSYPAPRVRTAPARPSADRPAKANVVGVRPADRLRLWTPAYRPGTRPDTGCRGRTERRPRRGRCGSRRDQAPRARSRAGEGRGGTGGAVGGEGTGGEGVGSRGGDKGGGDSIRGRNAGRWGRRPPPEARKTRELPLPRGGADSLEPLPPPCRLRSEWPGVLAARPRASRPPRRWACPPARSLPKAGLFGKDQ